MPQPRSLPVALRRHLPGVLVAALFAVVAGVYALTRWDQLSTGAYDLGIFDQAVRAYSRFEAPVVPIKGDGYLIFGDHFHPILVVLAPLYWVWDDPRTLLLAQAVLLAVSVVIVWRFALRRLRARWVAALVAVGYCLGWAVQGMVDFDFHEVAFAVPLLAWALDALDRRRDAELLVASGLLLLVREDMGVVVAMLGALRLVRGLRARPGLSSAPVALPDRVPDRVPDHVERDRVERDRPGWWSRSWPGAVMVAVGVAAFVVIVGVVVPSFNPSGHYSHWDYTGLGPDVGSSLRAVVAHPGTTLHLLVTPTTKVWTLFWLLLPVAFLPLRSPYALVALPLLVQRFLDDRSGLWTVHFHYNAPVWIVLVLAAVDGWCRLPAAVRRPAVGRPLVVALAAFPVVASLALSPSWTTMFPFGRMVTGSAFSVPGTAHDVAAALATVPKDTCVVASAYLAPRLDRNHVVTLTEVSTRHQDYLVLDLSAHEPDRFKLVDDVADIQPQPVYDRAVADGWVETARYGSVVVLRAPDHAAPSAACTP